MGNSCLGGKLFMNNKIVMVIVMAGQWRWRWEFKHRRSWGSRGFAPYPDRKSSCWWLQCGLTLPPRWHENAPVAVRGSKTSVLKFSNDHGGHGRQPEVECFVLWRGFASYHGQEKLLLMTVAWRCQRDGVKTIKKGKNAISGCRPWPKNVCA